MGNIIVPLQDAQLSRLTTISLAWSIIARAISISLSKLKVKKESTLQKEIQVVARRDRRTKIYDEKEIDDMSIQQWQDGISVIQTGATRQMLEAYGVVVVRQFIDDKDLDILNGCVRIAKLAAKYENLIESKVSGGTMLIDIPVDSS